MEYRAIRSGDPDPYFEHALFGGRQKGAQNKNHKYLARAWWQNKWRYAYTQAEVKAFQNLGKNQSLSEKQKISKLERESKEAKKTTDKIEAQAAAKIKTTANNAVTSVKGAANTLSGSAKKAADTVSNKASKVVYDTKKATKEFAEDVKSGVTAKQVAIKAETAKNDVKNAASRASEAAKTTADKGRTAAEKLLTKASNTAKSAADKASSTIKNTKESIREFENYSTKVDNDKRRAQGDMQTQNEKMHVSSRNAKEAERASDTAALEGNKQKAIDSQNRAESERRANSQASKAFDDAKSRYDQVSDEEKTTKYKMSDLLRNGTDSKLANEAKETVAKAAKDASKTAKSVADKGRTKAQELLDKAKNTASDIKDKASDAAERVADKVSDIKTNAEHKAYASEMKKKYGADSLHYQDAQALVEHDKAVDDLSKARQKYGTNSSEFKAAVKKEQAARDKIDEVHEQNLYANNSQYKKISDQASALGSYIDNMNSKGGPKTPEARANYQKAIQDLGKLETQLERMWNEDWE